MTLIHVTLRGWLATFGEGLCNGRGCACNGKGCIYNGKGCVCNSSLIPSLYISKLIFKFLFHLIISGC